MAFYKEQNTRIRLKRTATSGATPSVGPTPDHTDGSWGINDIYGGEFFWNMYDQALWLGWNTGTTSGVTLIYSGGTGGGGGTYTADNGLTENPTNNFQWGGALTQDTIIDGAGSFGVTYQALKEFYLYSDKNVYLYAANGGEEGILDIDPLTNQYLQISYDDGTDFTAIQMSGAKMVIKTPDFASKNNGDVLTLIDNTSGEVEYAPIPSSTFTGGTVTGPTDFTSGLTANTISATTYNNLPVSAITAGSNIVVSNVNGNVTVSQNNGGTNVLWKDATLYTSSVAANTILASKLIPANTFQVGDFYEYTINFSGNTTNGTAVTRRVYINTSASLVGAQQLAIFANSVGTNQYTALYRHGFVLATGTTGSFNSFGQATAISSILFNNSATQIFTINTTIDQYIIVATQVASTSFIDGFRGINYRITR